MIIKFSLLITWPISVAYNRSRGWSRVVVTWPSVNSQSEARKWTINLPILVTWLSTWYSNRPITAKEIITWYHVLSRDCHMTLSVLSRDRSQQPIRGQDFVTWPQSTANQRPECAPSYRVKGVPNAHNILLRLQLICRIMCNLIVHS